MCSSSHAEDRWTTAIFCGSGRLGHKDGQPQDAAFHSPNSIFCLNDGTLIVSDCLNNCLRRISRKGEVTTLTLRNTKTDSYLLRPMGICALSDGSLLVCDSGHNRIRKLQKDGTTYVATTFAGNGRKGFKDGSAIHAQFDGPCGIVQWWDGSIIIADKNNHRIRRIRDGHVSTIAGSVQGYQDGNAKMVCLNPTD